MKKKAMVTTLFFAASLITAGGVLAAEESRSGGAATGSEMGRSASPESGSAASGQERESAQDMAATGQSGEESRTIQAAEDLKNFTVQDTRGEKIGKVSQVLVDLESGRIGYAVVSSGGILGMGGDKYIVPFGALKQGQEGETLTLDIQKDQLQQAPKGDAEQVTDREAGREIHQFYGVSPYWEESGSQPQQESPEAGEMELDEQQQERQEQGETGM